MLLTPTQIYARPLLVMREALVARGWDIHGLAHITGGGLPGNVPRALPGELAARLDPTRWVMPSVMHVIGALAGMGDPELRATFNGGLGMIVVVFRPAVPTTIAELAGTTTSRHFLLVGEVIEPRRLWCAVLEWPLEVATGEVGR